MKDVPLGTITDIELYRQSFQARLQAEQAEREKARAKALQAVYALAPTVVARYPAITAAYLFGSILRPGAFRPNSDIDIAIEGGAAADYFALWHDLEDALPEWPIDLRDLPAGTPFTQKVYLTGEKIYG